MNRCLIRGALPIVVYYVGANSGSGLAAFDKRQHAGGTMTSSGGEHFNGLHQIGFAQAVLADQDIGSWYEIDHYLAP